MAIAVRRLHVPTSPHSIDMGLIQVNKVYIQPPSAFMVVSFVVTLISG